MSVTAGALSKVLIGQTTAQLSSAVATGGTSPYTYQWYRSTTSGFTPGAGNLLSGATALALSDSGLTGGTQYYYVVVATDTGASNATSQSAQLAVATEPVLSQNQFAQSSIVGVVDMKVGSTNIVAMKVDATVSTPIQPGQAVKIVNNTSGGVPSCAPISAKDDDAVGFAIFNIKDISYPANSMLEVALFGTVIWCYATAAIASFTQVCLDSTYIGGVQPTGATATVMGWAFDGCSGPGLIRVMLLQNAAFTTA